MDYYRIEDYFRSQVDYYRTEGYLRPQDQAALHRNENTFDRSIKCIIDTITRDPIVAVIGGIYYPTYWWGGRLLHALVMTPIRAA
jgi:hypothetical protein